MSDAHTDTLLENLLFLDPQDTLNQYIVGLGEGFGIVSITLVYDKDGLFDHWMKTYLSEDADLDEDDAYIMAVEWFDYNVIGAYVGPYTPVYMSRSDLDMFADYKGITLGEAAEGGASMPANDEDEDEWDKLTFLEPRSETDQFIVGIGLGFGGAMSYMYDKDRLLEHWKKGFLSESSELEDDEAFRMALDVFDHTLKANESAEFPPSFVSRDEYEVVSSKIEHENLK